MASEITKFALRIRHMRRHRDRLRAKVRQRGLAGLVRVNRDGVDLRAEGLVSALHRKIG